MPKTAADRSNVSIASKQWSAYCRIRTAIKRYLQTETPDEAAYNREVNKINAELKLTAKQMSGPLSMAFNDIAGEVASLESMQKFGESMFGSEDAEARMRSQNEAVSAGVENVPNLISNLGSGSIAVSKMTAAARDMNAVKRSLKKRSESGTATADNVKSDLARAIHSINYADKELDKCCTLQSMQSYSLKVREHVSKFYTNRETSGGDEERPKESCLRVIHETSLARGKVFLTVNLKEACAMSKRLCIPVASASMHNSVIKQEIERIRSGEQVQLGARYSNKVIAKIEQIGGMFNRISKLQSNTGLIKSSEATINEARIAESVIAEMSMILEEINQMPRAEINKGVFPSIIKACQKYVGRYQNFSEEESHNIQNEDLAINSQILRESAIFQKLNKGFQSEVDELAAISASIAYPSSGGGLSPKSIELKNGFIMELSSSSKILTSEIARVSKARESHKALKEEMFRVGRAQLGKANASDPATLRSICASLDLATKCAQSCSPKLDTESLKSKSADEIVSEHNSRMLSYSDLRRSDKEYDILRDKLEAQVKKATLNKLSPTKIKESIGVPNINEYGFSDEICDACDVAKKHIERAAIGGEKSILPEKDEFEAVRYEYLARFACKSKNGNILRNGEMNNIVSSVNNLEKIDLSSGDNLAVLRDMTDSVSCLTKQAMDSETASELIIESSKIASSTFKSPLLSEEEVIQDAPEYAVTREGRALIAACIRTGLTEEREASIDAILQNIFYDPTAETLDRIVENYKTDDASGIVLKDILCEFAYARIIAGKNKQIQEAERRVEAAQEDMLGRDGVMRSPESLDKDLVSVYKAESEKLSSLQSDLVKECYQSSLLGMSPSAVTSAKYRAGAFPVFDAKFREFSGSANKWHISESVAEMVAAEKKMSRAEADRIREEQNFIIQTQDTMRSISDMMRETASNVQDKEKRMKLEEVIRAMDGVLESYESPTLFNDMYSNAEHIKALNYSSMAFTEFSFLVTQLVELIDGIVITGVSAPFRSAMGAISAEQSALINSPGAKAFASASNSSAIAAAKNVLKGNPSAFTNYLKTLSPAQQYKTLKSMQSVMGFAWRHNLAQLISTGKGPLMGVAKTFLIVGGVGIVMNTIFLALSIQQAKIEADFKKAMIETMCAQGEKISALQIRTGDIEQRINKLSDEIEARNMAQSRYIKRCEVLDIPFQAGESSHVLLGRKKSKDITSSFANQIIESSSVMIDHFSRARSENSDTVSDMCNKLLCSPSEVENRVIDMRGIISSGIVPSIKSPLCATEEDVREGKVIVSGEFGGVKDKDPRFTTKARVPFSDSSNKPAGLAGEYLEEIRGSQRHVVSRIDEFVKSYNEFLEEQYSYSENLNNMISVCKLLQQYEELSNEEASAITKHRLKRTNIDEDSAPEILEASEGFERGLKSADKTVSLRDTGRQKSLCRYKLALMIKRIAPICGIPDTGLESVVVTADAAQNIKDWASEATKKLELKAKKLNSSIMSLNDLGYCVTTPYITSSRASGNAVTVDQKVAISNSDAITSTKLSRRDIDDAFKPNIFVKKGKLDGVIMPFSSPDRSVQMAINISKVRAIGTQNVKTEATKIQKTRDDKIQKAIMDHRIASSWVGEALKPRPFGMVR